MPCVHTCPFAQEMLSPAGLLHNYIDSQIIILSDVILVLNCILAMPLLGFIDRKIEFPLADEKTKRKIFLIHTSKMTLADDVDLEEYFMA